MPGPLSVHLTLFCDPCCWPWGESIVFRRIISQVKSGGIPQPPIHPSAILWYPMNMIIAFICVTYCLSLISAGFMMDLCDRQSGFAFNFLCGIANVRLSVGGWRTILSIIIDFCTYSCVSCPASLTVSSHRSLFQERQWKSNQEEIKQPWKSWIYYTCIL